jgi:fucose 4-O-acetylase-like acetyltransferase
MQIPFKTVREEIEPAFRETLSQDLYFVRGVAIVFVVLGHVIGERNTGIRQLYEQDVPSLAWLHEFIYTFHMPIFFIVSGISFAFFSKKSTTFLRFASSRAARLLIPLVCWAPVYFIFLSLSGSINFSIDGLIKSVIQPNFIFWFFPTLFFVSILAFLSLKLFRSQPNQSSFGSIVYLITAFIFFLLSFPLSGFLSTCLYWHIFFACGVLITPYLFVFHSKVERLPWSVKLLAFAFLFLIMLAVNYQSNEIIPKVVMLINGLIGFSLIYTIATRNKFKCLLPSHFLVSSKQAILYLGKISMSIYLFHVLCGSFTRTILVKVGMTELTLQFILGFTASLFGSVVIYHFLHTRSLLFLHSIGEFKGS